MSTARIFAAAVARQFGCDAGDVEDLKLALSEACSRAISHAQSDSSEAVTLIASTNPGILTFEVNGHRGPEVRQQAAYANSESDTGEHRVSLSAALIVALFPDAEFVDTADGIFFKLSVPAPTAA